MLVCFVWLLSFSFSPSIPSKRDSLFAAVLTTQRAGSTCSQSRGWAKSSLCTRFVLCAARFSSCLALRASGLCLHACAVPACAHTPAHDHMACGACVSGCACARAGRGSQRSRGWNVGLLLWCKSTWVGWIADCVLRLCV